MPSLHAAVDSTTDRIIALCELEVKARAFIKAGTLREYRTFPIISVDGKEYVPIKACNVIKATPDDLSEQVLLDDQRSALAKAKAAGMTRAEIRALISIDQEEVK